MFERHIPALWRSREPEREPSLFDLFEDMLGSSRTWLAPFYREGSWSGNISVDLVEQDDEFQVRAELPGVDPKDVDITIERGVLTIKAERREEHEEKKDTYLHRERSYGSYIRSIRLPGTVLENKVKASYDKGVLTVHLPKDEETKPRRIAIN